ncbi:Dam1p [Sporobolomyces salmoneus]|uniref:Dam1p n=1 Tax=Sporobolomyces salmoneus TaxID=183962 RepID=UPI0031700002
MTGTRPSRPTTPLRRISSHSLRSLSLSHSQSSHFGDSSTSDSSSSLAHLSPLFAELSDSVSDLVANCEGLSQISSNLDRFNEGFASYLYGLRINSYTFDFKHPPNKINFDLLNERRQRQEQQQQQEAAAARARTPDSPNARYDDHEGEGDRTTTMADSTFVTNDEQSFTHHPSSSSATSRSTSAMGRGRGGSGIARGRGRGTGRVGTSAAGGVSIKRRKEEIAAFADPVFPLLPINLRENRRRECENVLWTLKEHPNGMGLSDLTKHLASATPPIPQVRINEVLLALVRAKVATKGLVKGVNLYRLDPNRIV